jgi:hypothetical protein
MNSTRSRITAGIAVVALVLAVSGSALAGGRPFHADLAGTNEVPPADLTATGTVQLWLNPGQGTVCYALTASGLSAPAVAAHVHVAPAGTNGPVVVPLSVAADGSGSGCVNDVSRDLIQAIIQDPSAYYVNVHTTAFPGGAIRGQLSRSSTH